MCVVKVNRVEGNILGLPNKDPSHNTHSGPLPSPSSPVSELEAETDTHTVPQHSTGSGVTSRTPDGLRQWPQATQMHPGNNEPECCSPDQQDLSTSQDCSIRDLPLEDTELHFSPHMTSTSADSRMSLCLSDSQPHTSSSSCLEDTLNHTPKTDSSIDMGTENHTNNSAQVENMDTVVVAKHIALHSTTGAPYSLKTEPVEGGSNPLCGSLSPSGDHCSSENRRTEENLFPPLLQRNAADMPLLTPEPEGKVGICPLPPVLTQEMPSLTPANDGEAEVSRSASCIDQVAPVLQRETPTVSPSADGPKRENGETDSVMSKVPLNEQPVDNWHLASPFDCQVAAVSGSEGQATYLPANAAHTVASGGVNELLAVQEIAAEKNCTKLENVATRQSNDSPHQLVQGTAPQTEQQHSLSVLASKGNSAPRGDVLSLSSADSLSTGTSNNNPSSPSLPLCTQSDSHSALQLHHHTTFSNCTSQNPYIEPKPFSSSIWKNFNSHSPAVLIQSLNPDLPSDFSHDPLPYTMWTEPQCKEVTDLENSEIELHQAENQEEEGGPLTWAQLEPTSLVSVGAAEPMGLCGDYELHRGEGSEALSLCSELGRQREAKDAVHSDTVGSPVEMGGVEQDRGSDMEEGVSDGEEAEQQNSARGESSSESSDEEEEEEEEEENDARSYQCHEAGLEPGEICAVSALIHAITHVQPFTQN